MNEFQTHTLKNGIRLIHKHHDSLLAHFGFIVNTGSRDEERSEQGIAHFIEHVIFKGTAKRNAYRVISRLEDVGGEINAYTAKEETCVYSTFLNRYYERTIELICDILFNSTFPEKELLKEKEVVIDEINSYLDSPSEQIFDDFDEILFPNQSLGRNILGKPNIIRAFNYDDIQHFMKKRYHTDQMILSSVGSVKFDKLVRWTEKYFGQIPANTRKYQRETIKPYSPEIKEQEKGTFQTHCIIGNRAYHAYHDKRVVLRLLNNILGGSGLNSRLNMALREKHGYSYSVESTYSTYSDTGALIFYFGTDKKNLEKSIQLVHKEIKRLQTQKLGKLQLAKAKRQLIGHITIAAENQESMMLNMGKSLLLYDDVYNLQTVYRKIENVSANDIIEVANEIIDINELSMLIYK